MKVAVNKCYGGFGLSLLGVQKCAERKGKKVYFYRQTKYEWKHGYNEYEKIHNIDSNAFLICAYTKDFGDITRQLDSRYYFTSMPENRTDPDLIATIEELGYKASGPCSKIEIVEIPDDIEYEIEEYDGWEWVSEKHRTW